MINCEHSLCVILETHPLCSVSSSYAPIKELHDTPRGSLQVKVNPGLDRLDAELNHALLPNAREITMEQIDTHT